MRRVRTVERLAALAKQRRAVTYPNWDNPCSAAFVIGMQCRTVLQFIKRGMYEYPNKHKQRKWEELEP